MAGSVTSQAKHESSKANGRLGGRPRRAICNDQAKLERLGARPLMADLDNLDFCLWFTGITGHTFRCDRDSNTKHTDSLPGPYIRHMLLHPEYDEVLDCGFCQYARGRGCTAELRRDGETQPAYCQRTKASTRRIFRGRVQDAWAVWRKSH